MFCQKCGQMMEQLPTFGYSTPEFGCRNPGCPNIHPYWLSERIQELERVVKELMLRSNHEQPS